MPNSQKSSEASDEAGLIAKNQEIKVFFFIIPLSKSLPSQLLPASLSSHLPFKVSEGK